MKNLSKPAKLLISAALFAACYIPINLVWEQVLPSYSQFVASASDTFVNMIEFSDTSYSISVEESNYRCMARVPVTDSNGSKKTYRLSGTRRTDMVAYNMSLWAALLLATVAFLKPSARWRFLLIAPVIIFLWHICDLTIFAKNTRWIIIKDLNGQNPSLIDYSYSWHWFWYWAKELNRRIIDPFLPILLWIIFCTKSYFVIKKVHA